MRMLDLFSGIGGFSLAAEWVWGDELEIVGFCENEPYPQKVLKKNFPGVPIYKDIKELDGEAFKDIDLITGGFPCQDISVAGKGAGIEGARSGLWSEMHRLISHIRPRYVIIENVPMLTVRGGTRVISDLAEIGMDAEWQIVGADDVGAWHRRKRIWIVAYPPHPETVPLDSNSSVPGSHRKEVQFHGETELRNQQVSDSGPVGAGVSRSGNDGKETGNVSHTKHDGRYGVQESEGSGSRIHSQAGQSRAEQSKGSDSGKGRNEDLAYAKSGRSGEIRHQSQTQGSHNSSECDSQRFPADYWLSEPDVGLLADGLSTGLVGYWDREPDIPRVSTGVKDRVNKLKGLGNAIVPQCAIVIMELIKQADAKPQ